MNLIARIILWGMLMLMLKDTATASRAESQDTRSPEVVSARRMQ